VADASTRRLLGLTEEQNATLYNAVGCGRCNQTGYEGRIGVYELIVVDEKLKRLIHDGANEQDIVAHAFHHAETLTQSGFRHALAGATSIEEVLRVVRQEDDDAGL
jgi:general secretion pathway protein E